MQTGTFNALEQNLNRIESFIKDINDFDDIQLEQNLNRIESVSQYNGGTLQYKVRIEP